VTQYSVCVDATNIVGFMRCAGLTLDSPWLLVSVLCAQKSADSGISLRQGATATADVIF